MISGYQWYDNGGAIGGATGGSYNTSAGQIGHSISSAVTACNADSSDCLTVGSSNSITVAAPPPPPNSAPYTPFEDTTPADGAVLDGAGSVPFYMKYSDPDGNNGYITYTIRNSVGAVVQQFQGTTGPSGADSIGYTATSLASSAYSWTAVATDSYGASSGTSASHAFSVNVAPSQPAPGTPTTGAQLPTLSPVLTVSSSDPEGDTIGYQFMVASDSACSVSVITSGFLPNTPSYTVPAGALADGQTYYWCARARDWASRTAGYDTHYVSGWSAARSFSIQLPRMGARSYWPMWSDGPIAVNESTGNLVLAVPGPSFPTAAGTLGASFTFNLLDTRASILTTGGRGAWTFADGSGSPAKLIDHSKLTGDNGFDAVELVSGDGSSDWFGHVANSNTYQAAAGDLTVLTAIAGGFQVTEANGSIYTFGVANPTTGVATATHAEIYTANGQAHLDYAFDPSGRPTSITAIGNDGGGVARTLGALTFDWSCAGALLCITTPDTGAQPWRYVGATGATGALTSVFDGVRPLAIMQIGYDVSGRPIALQNANDLDRTNASPGYLTGHSLNITYGTGDKVQTVSSSARSRYVGPTTQLSRWTFAYNNGAACPGVTLAAPSAATHAFTRLPLGGCTDLTPPNQDGLGSPAKLHLFYDILGHPLEVIDALGHHTLFAYDKRNQLEWTEDQLNQPTDTSYDPFTFMPQSVTGADPDGAGGPLPAPTTSYRYDETNVGTPTAGGPLLQGLQGAYYSNPDLSGFPAKVQTDANIDSASIWGGAGPPALSGQATNFSVRWTGVLNVASTGTYVLSTVADGGTRVSIDNPTVAGGSLYETVAAINQWTGQTTGTAACSQPVTLMAGAHHLVVEYHELTGTPSVKLQFGATCGTGTSIATSALTPGWLNRTSTLVPPTTAGGTARVLFSHFAQPEMSEPDYTLATNAGTSLITSFLYDNYGRVSAKTLPKGNVGRLNADGTLSGTGDPNYTTTYTYYVAGASAAPPARCGGAAVNQAGLPQSVSVHGLTTKTSVYDLQGNPIALTNGAGTTCRTFDHEGRLTSDSAPDEAAATTYTYDPAGQLRTATNSNGTNTFIYNEHGSLIDGTDSFGAEAENVYDADGNVVSHRAATVALATGPVYTTSYTFDAGDQETSLTDSASRTWNFFYNERGALNGTANPNGTFSWNDYLPGGWLSATYNRHGTINATTTTGTLPADSSPLADFTYQYNPDGTKAQEQRTPGQGVGGSLTVSGNETTDAVRSANNQGDGRAAPDSSYGVWQPETNLIGNGGLENGIAGWTAVAGATLAADSTVSKFGTSSLKITTTTVGQGASTTATVSAASTYTFSAWLNCNSACVTAGTVVQPKWDEYIGGTLNNTKTGSTQALLSGWNKVTFSATTATSITSVTTAVKVTSNPSVVYLDGAQLELGNVGTPFINTSSAGKNLMPNGGFEVTSTGWSALGGVAITRDTATAKFGTGSLKVTGTATGQGALANAPVSAGTAYTSSLYISCNAACVTAGTQVQPQWDENIGGNYSNTKSGAVATLASGWNRISMTATTWASITSINAYFKITANPSTVWVDAAQVEAGSTTTAYADTNGGTNSRAADRVQVPTTGLSATQGWMAMRFRAGWGTSAPPQSPSAFPALFDWRADANNRLSAYFVPGSNAFILERRNTTASATVGSAALSFNKGDSLTVVLAWTSSSLSISVNGGAFVTAAGTNVPTGLPALLDLAQIAGNNSFLNSDVLWAAIGTGTLTNADATTLNGFGSPDPAIGSVPGNPSLLWTADTPSFVTALETTSYVYDNIGRLSHVTLPSGVGRDYAYDLDSNRTSIVENGVEVAHYNYTPATTPGVDELTTVVAGATTAYTYGTDGQTLTRGADTLTWDGRGRLRGGTFNGSAVVVTFDATGSQRQRTAVSATTNYLLGGQMETASGAITIFSITGPAGDVARYNGPPTTATPTYLYYNGHGDAATQLVGSQTTPTAANTFRYDPFGTLTPTETGTSTVKRYTGAWGKRLDPTSNLIQMGARPYDPALGRFLSTDPIDGGSLNNYDYAGQDPINGYDLNGLRPTVDGWDDFAVWYPNAGSSDAIVILGAGNHQERSTTNRRVVAVAKALVLVGATTNLPKLSDGTTTSLLLWDVMRTGGRNPDQTRTPWSKIFAAAIQCIAGGIEGAAVSPPPFEPLGAAAGCAAGAAFPPGSTGPKGPP